MKKNGAVHGDLEGLICPDFKCSSRNLSSSFCSLMFSRYTLQSFNVAFGVNSMAWSHLDHSSSFSKTALLKTRSLKSSCSFRISPSTSSEFSLLLLMFSSSLLYASSSRLTNNTFSPSSITSSWVSSSISSSGSSIAWIFLHYCQHFWRFIKESFQLMVGLCFCSQLYPKNRSWLPRLVTNSCINSWWSPIVMFILTTSITLLSLLVDPSAL